MGDYTFADIGAAIDEVQTRLGVAAPKTLLQEFQFGLHPIFLAYEKGRPIKHQHTAFVRCLVGAASALNQPAHYYDIFGACRRVKLIQLLNRAIKVHDHAKTKGVDARLTKLKSEMSSDGFDAIIFELVVGACYVLRPGVAGLEYVQETSVKRTPDIMMRQHGRTAFCECKKLAQSKDFAIQMRAAANTALGPTLAHFRSARVSVSGEVVFNADPLQISPERLRNAMLAALKSGTSIVENDFVVNARELPLFTPNGMQLYPSPGFSWDRYRYRIRGEWMGLVHALFAKPDTPVDPPGGLVPGRPSWFSHLAWDCGIKWRIGEAELLAKYRRFAFNTIKHGLPQLHEGGGNSTIHAWLESDYFLGGRADVLDDFRNNLASDPKATFGWLVVNETLLDVSPKGYFDLIEHGHYMRGPTAVSLRPEVTNVFTSGDIHSGSFGVGIELPDIDE